jgi:hypothetical protein
MAASIEDGFAVFVSGGGAGVGLGRGFRQGFQGKAFRTTDFGSQSDAKGLPDEDP